MRQNIYFGLTIICLSFLSCSKGPDFVRAYGHDASETRNLDPFNKIYVSQKFVVFITCDTTKPISIKIDYGSNLLKKISAEISDGTLKIRDENHFNWVRKLDVHPTCTLNIHHLDEIVAEGVSEIRTLDTIVSQNFVFHARGAGSHDLTMNCGSITGECDNAGTVIFRGSAGIFAWSCENGSAIDASQMRTADVYLYHYTAREVSVNPGIIFKAYVYGKGNVVYYRDPVYLMETHTYGEGRVLKQ